jgi:2-octaprenyl-6-methoxyphenol hydroxylase
VIKKQLDIIIIGGGLTGATLMLALHDLGYSTLLIESKSFSDKVNPDFDARSLALSPASMRILNMLGVWAHLKEFATAIDSIHVSEKHQFGVSRLQSEADNPLGYVLEMQYINRALHQVLAKDRILAPARLSALDLENNLVTVTTDSGDDVYCAQLIVAADGAESSVRKLAKIPAEIKKYHQHALVTNIGLTKAHNNRAYERFTPQGPLALLPMDNNRMSLVWAMPPEKAQELMHLSDDEFLLKVQTAFGYRLGRLVKAGKRYTYPLQQVLMPKQAHWPLVFVGNAAHTLHPVAGQGFNLGLRDVATLAQCIANRGLNAPMLDEYVTLRRHDQQAITRLTDGLIDVFTSRIPGMGVARGMGLIAFDTLPFLKNLLARYARGFGGVTPDLVCEIALSAREV